MSISINSSHCLVVSEQRLVQDGLRRDLLTVLEHAVFGDRLAAEYFLCHLIAGVYGRADVMPLGKFSINLSNCPRSTSYSDLLHHLVSNLVTQVCGVVKLLFEPCYEKTCFFAYAKTKVQIDK